MIKNEYFFRLKERIRDKTAKIAVIGLGYVGLPLALEFSKKEYTVFGLETSDAKVKKLKLYDSYIEGVNASDIFECIHYRTFIPTTDFKVLADVDVISICVPTPLKDSQTPDLSYIQDSVRNISRYMKKGVLIILESTSYPGTTEEIIENTLNKGGCLVGENYFLCFSSERVNPGNSNYSTWDIPKVIGGTSPLCLELATDLYGHVFGEIVPVSSPKVAEMSKLLENTFRSINIAFINEMSLLCEKADISIWETIKVAKSKPFGFMPFLPGPGIGGHCIPLDPMYLAWRAKEMNFFSRFIELANEINKSMPGHTVNMVSNTLNIYSKSLKGSRILILGLTYKPDINDIRESPALEIIDLLSERGAIVNFHDPYVHFFLDKNIEKVNTVELDYSELEKYDCVVLVTNHSCYDYQSIADHAMLIIDTRNGFEGIESGNIQRIGESINVAVPSYQL